jgi:hypothetical protein
MGKKKIYIEGRKDYIVDSTDNVFVIKRSKDSSWKEESRSERVIELNDTGDDVYINFKNTSFKMNYLELFELYVLLHSMRKELQIDDFSIKEKNNNNI